MQLAQMSQLVEDWIDGMQYFCAMQSRWCRTIGYDLLGISTKRIVIFFFEFETQRLLNCIIVLDGVIIRM